MENASTASLRLVIPDSLEMEKLGQFLASLFHPGDCICLIGGLGAGKTTLVRGFARGLGYTGRVTSPTFTLMNQYDCHPPIVHLDFYRLDAAAMVEDLGLDDYWHQDAIMLIEWPQIGMEALPQPAMKIEIDLINEDYDLGRQVTFSVPNTNAEMLERLKNYADTCH